jgi:class 3 adenylate cyclase/tetratricopeptide (TPR) repeat protein
VVFTDVRLLMSLNVCTQCGEKHLAESNFCNRCGAPIGERAHSSRFVSPEKKEAERKLVSILFADIVGSTSIVDGLDPEDALDELGPALEAMKAAVKRFGGTICREQGDGILAFFGAPKADDHHPVNACLAGLDIVRAVEHLAHRKMQARAGIHSGEVLIRLVDGEFGSSYDATGAAVHLASRLESIAQPGSALVSAATYSLALPYFDFVSRAPIILKGFTQAIPVFSISGPRNISRWLARGGKNLSLFVGREAELGRLTASAERAANGVAQAILVSGTAGAGKSRLAHEFVAGLARDGWSIIEAEAQPAGQAKPYGVLKRILLSWMGCSELDTAATLAAALEQRLNVLHVPSPHFVSALRSVLDLTVDHHAWREAEPGFRRRHVVDALKLVISSTADGSPLVLLLEDLHWIDGDSATVICRLQQVLRDTTLLILGTARSGPQIPIDLGLECTELQLSALDATAAVSLLDILLGTGAGLAGLKARLLEKTGGIPLFIEEVVRQLIDTGALIGSRGAYTLTLSPEEVGIPPTVQAIISTRVDALPERYKRVLQGASVLGQPITNRLLEAMLGKPEHELDVTVRELENAGFLSRIRTLPELEFSFPHELIREVVYSALVREQRRRLHDKALMACVQVLSDRLDEYASPLAHHAHESQNWTLLLRFSHQAASRAVERSAFREAALQFQRAIESITKQPRSRELDEIAIDIRLQSRLAFSATSQLSVWIEYAKQAEEMASAIGDERRELGAMINRAQALNFAGTPKQSVEIAEPALSRASASQFRDLEITAWFIIGQANYAAGNYRQTADLLETQMPLLRGTNATKRFGTAGTTSVLYLIMIGVAAISLGEFERARIALEEASQIAQQTSRPYDAVACSYCRGILLSSTGETATAIVELRRGLELCRDYSINLFVPLIVGQLGAALTAMGLHDQAISLLEKVVREAELLGHNVATVFANYALAAAYKAGGKFEEALTLATACLGHTRKYGFRGVEGRVLLFLGLLELASAAPDAKKAEPLIRGSIELARSLNALPNLAQAQSALAELLARTGRPSQALEAAGLATELFDSMGSHFRPEEISRVRL